MSAIVLQADAHRIPLADASVDAVVTDPPYGISFMGHRWDYAVPGVEAWSECFRVLKPGGYLLSFFGTRTYHRGVCPIEDAGFEIRDQIQWLYGQGFPKSLNVSKAIDEAAGAERPVLSIEKRPDKRGGNYHGACESRPDIDYAVTGPATDDAKKWNGWGTALKPAHEPVVVARKPLEGTVIATVLKYGTGAINIDGCRIESDEARPCIVSKSDQSKYAFGDGINGSFRNGETTQGRYPANVIHDGSDEVLAAFPVTESVGHSPTRRGKGGLSTNGHAGQEGIQEKRFESGSAARFFFCAKASKQDRNEGLEFNPAPLTRNGALLSDCEKADWTSRGGNHHSTVKPTALMRYLVRLVTQPGGIVLDPFMGSGSTGKAAALEGMQFIGCDLDWQWAPIARRRIEYAMSVPMQTALFG